VALVVACTNDGDGGASASGSGGAAASGDGVAGLGGTSGSVTGAPSTAGGSTGVGGVGNVGGTNGTGDGGDAGDASSASSGGASGASGSGGTSNGGSAGASGMGGTGGESPNQHWVGTWTGAPQLTEVANLPPSALSNTTLRQVVRVSLGGTQIRLRFSNEFGNGPVTINQAHVAVCSANPVDSTIDVATDEALSFSGSASVTIAQGTAVWSDPLNFDLAALSNLSVTTAFGSVPSDVTGHPGSRTTSYQQTGSADISAANMASAQTTDHWYVLSGVDVMADEEAQGIVILGDSITDGRGSTTNGNDRWPDVLAPRLLGNAATSKVSVMNQGIGGNGLLGGLGPSATSRFDRDVLGQSAVKWVIIFEGVNDIGGGASTASLTAAYDEMIGKAHAQDLLIYGATITPFGSNGYYSVPHETVRQEVNAYIRSGVFDGYIDFDAAVRDGSNPPLIQGAYDSGDGLHLSPAGYQHLADTVDLDLFTN
jgi:lysophospholipase L1-like esterase